MAVGYTYYKGSKTGDVEEAKGHKEPKPTEVIIKLTHSGVCGTDEHARYSDAGLGHEGVGTIVEVGSQVHGLSDFRVGDRVGTSYFHSFCGSCKQCSRSENPFHTSIDSDRRCPSTYMHRRAGEQVSQCHLLRLLRYRPRRFRYSYGR